MDFPFFITARKAGSKSTFRHRHHRESVHRMSGKPRPAVDWEPAIVCCSNPPATGTEVNREDASHAPAE